MLGRNMSAWSRFCDFLWPDRVKIRARDAEIEQLLKVTSRLIRERHKLQQRLDELECDAKIRKGGWP